MGEQEGHMKNYVFLSSRGLNVKFSTEAPKHISLRFVFQLCQHTLRAQMDTGELVIDSPNFYFSNSRSDIGWFPFREKTTQSPRLIPEQWIRHWILFNNFYWIVTLTIFGKLRKFSFLSIVLLFIDGKKKFFLFSCL